MNIFPINIWTQIGQFPQYKKDIILDNLDSHFSATIEYENEEDALDNQDSNAKDLDSSDSDDEGPKDLGILHRPMPRNQHPPTPIITDDEDGSNEEEEIIFEREKPIAEEAQPMELFHNYSNSEEEDDEDVNQPKESDKAHLKDKEDTSSNATIAARPMESPPKQYRTRAVIKRARDRLLRTSPTYRQMQKLKTDYNPIASNVVNKIDKQVNEENDTNEKANVHFEVPLWNYIFLEQQLGREETCHMIIDVQKLELPDAYTHTHLLLQILVTILMESQFQKLQSHSEVLGTMRTQKKENYGEKQLERNSKT